MQVIFLVSSYLGGSIPFGLLVGKIVRGIDIRFHGSGNIGATNVARVVGKPWGIVVFFLDFAKGFLPLIIAFRLFPSASRLFLIIVALATIAGHNWSIFLGLKGGKGVSTSIGTAGALCIVYPPLLGPVVAALVCWSVIFLFTRYVSLASLCAAFIFGIAATVFLEQEFKVFSWIIVLFIFIRHRRNIMNLIRRKELNV